MQTTTFMSPPQHCRKHTATARSIAKPAEHRSTHIIFACYTTSTFNAGFADYFADTLI